jgi:hypothetical protein
MARLWHRRLSQRYHPTMMSCRHQCPAPSPQAPVFVLAAGKKSKKPMLI